MSVRIEPASGALIVPDMVDELVTDPAWVAVCDQVCAAVHRRPLPALAGVWRGRQADESEDRAEGGRS